MSYRASIGLRAELCTSCMICVRQCPAWCIDLSAQRVHDADAGPRGRSTLQLESFTIDYGLCMDCGICVDVCPTDALVFSEIPNAADQRPNLVLGIDGLAQLVGPSDS